MSRPILFADDDTRARSLLEFSERARADLAGPRVFVYMAAFGRMSSVTPSVQSVLAQTHREFELCVVADAAAADAVRSIAGGDRRVEVVPATTTSRAAALNDALQRAPTDARYLIGHDAGDVSEPTKLATLVAHLERHHDVDVVGCQTASIGSAACTDLPTHPDEMDRAAHDAGLPVHGAALYRRQVQERLRGYREFDGAEGHDFIARALEAGFRVANRPEVLHRTRCSSCDERIRRRLLVSLPWRTAHRAGRPAEIALQLGCGERYLDGYVNVDLGGQHHTVQRQRRPDLEEDLRFLMMPPGTCREIRSHHVFEHFPRTEALRLLIEWHRWLADGGKLVVETPDLAGSLDALRGNQPPRLRARVLRHLFGSQEAAWAYHVDAWDESRFRHVLPRLGFDVEHVEHTEWQGLANVIVTARRVAIDSSAQRAAAVELLDEALVDHSPSELRLRDVWLGQLLGRSFIRSRR